MAFTFQGIGTKFYGKRDFRDNGSYVTTEWIVFVYIPLLPLRSFRVVHQGPGDYQLMLPPVAMGSSERYAVLEKTPPNWKQVVSVYGFVGLCAAWFTGTVFATQYLQETIMPKYFIDRPMLYTVIVVAVFATGFLLPLVPWHLRFRARALANRFH